MSSTDKAFIRSDFYIPAPVGPTMGREMIDILLICLKEGESYALRLRAFWLIFDKKRIESETADSRSPTFGVMFVPCVQLAQSARCDVPMCFPLRYGDGSGSRSARGMVVHLQGMHEAAQVLGSPLLVRPRKEGATCLCDPQHVCVCVCVFFLESEAVLEVLKTSSWARTTGISRKVQEGREALPAETSPTCKPGEALGAEVPRRRTTRTRGYLLEDARIWFVACLVRHSVTRTLHRSCFALRGVFAFLVYILGMLIFLAVVKNTSIVTDLDVWIRHRSTCSTEDGRSYSDTRRLTHGMDYEACVAEAAGLCISCSAGSIVWCRSWSGGGDYSKSNTIFLENPKLRTLDGGPRRLDV